MTDPTPPAGPSRPRGQPTAPHPSAARTGRPTQGLRRRPHPDRVGLAPWLRWAIVAATAVAVGSVGQLVAGDRLPPVATFAIAALAGALVVIAIPSVSIRLAARLSLALSAVMLVRFGLLGGSITTAGQGVLVWLVAGVAVLVLSDRIGTDANVQLGPADGARQPPLPPTSAVTARTVATVAVAVVLLVLLLAPLVVPHVGRSTESGTGPNFDPLSGASSLRSTGSLDMTRRPELTDDVVFTVESPVGTFWRGETFDRWDGRTWTRSDDVLVRVSPDGSVRHGPDDLAATGDDLVRQRFRIEAEYSDVVFAAATADAVALDRVAVQRSDGTLISAPLGRGATYTVTSRRVPLTETRLRGVDGGTVPTAVSERYAQEPSASGRVLAAARRVAGGERTTYDKVRALERWMGGRTQYSLDAPLAPRGVDVVDHFLFTSQQGWCEQVASSLVVMARANGIPARLVTGFVPGDQDSVTGTFTVQARDAHAWAEVWFPEVGWVPFDPTADVPLAGVDGSDGTWWQWLVRHWVVIALVLVAVAVVLGPVRSLVRRWLARRAAPPIEWAAVADARLASLGERVDRPRSPGETATAYATDLAARYRDPRLASVGTAIDDALFAPAPPDSARRAAVDDVLAELTEAEIPQLARA